MNVAEASNVPVHSTVANVGTGVPRVLVKTDAYYRASCGGDKLEAEFHRAGVGRHRGPNQRWSVDASVWADRIGIEQADSGRRYDCN